MTVTLVSRPDCLLGNRLASFLDVVGAEAQRRDPADHLGSRVESAFRSSPVLPAVFVDHDEELRSFPNPTTVQLFLYLYPILLTLPT